MTVAERISIKHPVTNKKILTNSRKIHLSWTIPNIWSPIIGGFVQGINSEIGTRPRNKNKNNRGHDTRFHGQTWVYPERSTRGG